MWLKEENLADNQVFNRMGSDSSDSSNIPRAPSAATDSSQKKINGNSYPVADFDDGYGAGLDQYKPCDEDFYKGAIDDANTDVYRPRSNPFSAGFVSQRRLSRKQMTEYLWPNVFPIGCLSMLTGKKASGKSMVAADICYRVACGKPMPFCSSSSAIKGASIYITKEMNIDELSRILLSTGIPAELEHCLGLLTEKENALVPKDKSIARMIESKVTENNALYKKEGIDTRVRVVIIDPLTDYIPGINTNSEDEVRPKLNELTTLASRLNIAIICIRHHKKTADSDPRKMTLGSVAFGAVARSCVGIYDNPKDDNSRVFAVYDSNSVSRRDYVNLVVGIEKRVDKYGHYASTWQRAPRELTAEYCAQMEVKKEFILARGGQLSPSKKLPSQSPSQSLTTTSKAKKKSQSVNPEIVALLVDKFPAGTVAQRKEVETWAAKSDLQWKQVDRAAAALGVIRKTTGFQEKSTSWTFPLSYPTSVAHIHLQSDSRIHQ